MQGDERVAAGREAQIEAAASPDMLRGQQLLAGVHNDVTAHRVRGRGRRPADEPDVADELPGPGSARAPSGDGPPDRWAGTGQREGRDPCNSRAPAHGFITRPAAPSSGGVSVSPQSMIAPVLASTTTESARPVGAGAPGGRETASAEKEPRAVTA